jgi:type IV pilus assembly protein PilC
VGVLAAAIVRLCIGPAGWQRLVATIPIVGPLSHWLGVAEWSSLLSVLVENRIPLPEALRLAADGCRNANLGQLSLGLAEGAEKGQTLWQMLTTTPEIPSSLVPLVRWGEEKGMLAEALAASREMLEKRVRMRSLLVKSLFPPILFIAIGCCVVFLVIALFMPGVSLIQGLSG